MATASMSACGYVLPGSATSSAHVPAQSNPLVFHSITAKNRPQSYGSSRGVASAPRSQGWHSLPGGVSLGTSHGPFRLASVEPCFDCKTT
jgi:hypothetical protein